jgi:hypothetical protein
LTNQCQQWSLPHSKLASTKVFSNTQDATCQLQAFEEVIIVVPHPGAVPVHCHKKCLTWSTSATKLVNSMQNICINVDNFPRPPTTKRLVVTSGFCGWCSIVSLWQSCHCGKTFSIMPCACQDVASRVKISQITYFSLVFSGKKTLSHGESET